MNTTFGEDIDNAHVLIAVCAKPEGGTDLSMAIAPGISFESRVLASILRDFAEHLEDMNETMVGEDA